MLTLEHVASGKVREIYALDDRRLVMVATDRISAFDVILDDVIPDKGRVLTALTLFWLDLLNVPNHLLTADVSELEGARLNDDLRGRTMVVRKAEVIPVECVVRGYLYGSAWREYESGGGPTTEHLPAGLRKAERLEDPIFTPATKAEVGHDQNLTEAQARADLGDDLYETLRSRSIELYSRAASRAAQKGILLADTKFEFGFADDELLLIDEVLTPDSSRYWPAAAWGPGSSVPSFDKQYVRDWLQATGWDLTPPAPRLPPEVIAGTRRRYIEAFQRLTGNRFAGYLAPAGSPE